MAFTSYAQNFEDVLLWRALQHVTRGVYVDVGAQDPIVASVSRGFYEQGWRGIHVEPAERMVERLRRDRPDEIIIQSALSDRSEHVRFFEVPETGLSSCSARLAELHRHQGWKVKETKVPAIALDEVMANASGADIHWLRLSDEDFKRTALKGWRRSAAKPWVVIVKSVDSRGQSEVIEDCEAILQARGYTFVHFDGRNRFYLSSQHWGLRGYFLFGPSFQDGFQLSETSRSVSAVVQKYRQISSQHEVDINEMSAKARADVGELNAALASVQRQLAENHENLDHVSGELSRSQDESRQVRIELSETQAKLEDAGGELGRARATIEQAKAEQDQFQNESQQARIALHETQGQLGDAREELRQARAIIEQAKTELGQTQIENANLHRVLEQARQQSDQSNTELRISRAELDSMQAKFDYTKLRLENTENVLLVTQTQLGESQAELRQVRAELRRANLGRDEAQGDLSQTRGALDQTRETLMGTQRELVDLQAEAHRLRTDVALSRRELTWTVNALGQSQGAFDEARASLSRADRDLVSTRVDLLDARQELDLVYGELESLHSTLINTFDRRDRQALLQSNEELAQTRAELDRARVECSQLTNDLTWNKQELAKVKDSLRWKISRLFWNTDRRREGIRVDVRPEAVGPVTGAQGRIVYSVDQLLALRDEAFVQSAYLNVLGREPEEHSLRYYLARLRHGETRRSILIELALSPTGARQKSTLRGLERMIRHERWRRRLLVGPILRLLGRQGASVDIPRKLSVIETQLELLTRITSEQESVERNSHGFGQSEISPVPSVRRQTTEHIATAPINRPDGAVWTAPLAWQIEASDDDTLFPAEFSRALSELGHRMEKGGLVDVIAAFTSPSVVGGAATVPTLLVGHDWDESGYPVEWIDRLNAEVQGVACVSSHAVKILIDHGLNIPIVSIGMGVEHWDRVPTNPDYRISGKIFRFLHVSSCDHGSGIDILLESFGRAFNAEDDVCLVVKSLGLIPSSVRSLLTQLRNDNENFPEIILIEEHLTQGDLKALYNQCHVFVTPSRAEGFGLPIAQALLSGLPVVATAWGGHLDYCEEANSWLVDYRFARAKTVNDLVISAWAEPLPAALDDALGKAFRATPAERFAKAWSGRKRLLDNFTWKDAAARLAMFTKQVFQSSANRRQKAHTGWMTTWNVRCGIFTHVEHLVELLPENEFYVLAARQEPRTRVDETNCLRSWNPGKDVNGFEDVIHELDSRSISVLIVQFNYGFYNHKELSSLISEALSRKLVVIIDVHSTVDPRDEQNFRLEDLADAMRMCHRILAHSATDMNRLKALGIVKNVTLLPAGMLNRQKERSHLRSIGTLPLIGCFGFALPNKGLPELVEAAGILREQGRAVRLLMLNSEHPAPESAAEIAKINEAIARLGLQELVELKTEFLDDDMCLALLSSTDLVVNPYQRTGESASGSVRFGLSAGVPVAVTPLSLFDDLGDAVFRLPGTAPREIAQGIVDALVHLEEQSETARLIQSQARRWVEAHDFAQQGIRLVQTAEALLWQQQAFNQIPTVTEERTKGKTSKPQAVARGVFINTAEESCSIFESGRMVYNCINASKLHKLDYFSLDQLDVEALTSRGKIQLRQQLDHEPVDVGNYDYWVFNWHFITMASQIGLEAIAKLPGKKFTIILELEPGNPLKHIQQDVFDGYIALDPAAFRINKIFPFPRPLEGNPHAPRPRRDVPIIGSFGFGTPGKGFELLVEAINREFDKAIVRINIPEGAYTSSFDRIHGESYPRYLASLCRRIAKPGIEIQFSSLFMSPEELVAWCGDNDLNCFLYTRRQAGLSATTDQAIMSGQPLVTGSNDTFRHIHQYIPPYPEISLSEAISFTAPLVKEMQEDWSRASFGQTFEKMLAEFGIVSETSIDREEAASKSETVPIVMMVSSDENFSKDVRSYATRLADCIGRSGTYVVHRVQYGTLPEFKKRFAEIQPTAVVLTSLEDNHEEIIAIAGAAAKIVLVPGARIDLAKGYDDLLIFERRPIVPYYTLSIPVKEGAPRIWLIGFSDSASNLEEVVDKISRGPLEVEIMIEAPEWSRAGLERRLSKLQTFERFNTLTLSVVSLTGNGDEIINEIAQSQLSIFYNDSSRTSELEDLCCLTMATERAVVFTRCAPFAHFVEHCIFVEDITIGDAIRMGMAAQVKLCHDFSEGQSYMRMRRLLNHDPDLKPS